VYLKLGDQFCQEPDNQYQHFCKTLHTLRTKDGLWAGVIFHHDPCGLSPGHELELVLISGGHVAETDEDHQYEIPEWRTEEQPRSQERYEFYHALCVEWQDGIAERRGLARVPQNIWDTIAETGVEVRLG
jgi:hypothetical protein